MKPLKLLIAIIALGILSGCNHKAKELKEAVDRCNVSLDSIEKLDIEPFAFNHRHGQTIRKLKMALRRDSCYNTPDIEPILPDIADVLKRYYNLEIERWGKGNETALPHIGYTRQTIQAQEIIRLGNKRVPFVYDLKELDDYHKEILKALEFLQSDPVKTERNTLFIGIGQKYLQRYSDRRIEILAGNLYHSNLFLEIGNDLELF